MSFGFDFGNIKEEEAFGGLLPNGEYKVFVDNAEIKKTKSGTGYYINVKLKLKGNDKYDNAVLWDIVNIKNDNETAQEIGRQRLKRMLTIAGVAEDKMKDAGPESLIGKEYKVRVGVDKSKDFGDRNKITAYFAMDSLSVDDVRKATGGDEKPSWM